MRDSHDIDKYLEEVQEEIGYLTDSAIKLLKTDMDHARVLLRMADKKSDIIKKYEILGSRSNRFGGHY
ncbi:Uncharacterised protein [Streptococcus pneumoniae]|nr:Uncharacterised protein [Streptococcus pneumoniae]